MRVHRRGFLLGAAATGLSARAPRSAPLAPLSIRVASNQGAENAALQQLMIDRGFARDLALEIAIVESKDIAGPIAAIEAGRADLCMISAYAGVLPAIEAGQPVRLIGTAMQVPALAVCSANPAIRSVHDLAGHSVGIGEQHGLLHLLMLALLRRAGIAADAVRFVTVGSNAQVFRAVASGAVDAGPFGITNLPDPHTHTLHGGELWRALPDFTYQLSYASLDALRDRGEAVARCLAAYARLFRFVSQPDSKPAYVAARVRAGGDPAEAAHAWDFIQRVKPYARLPGLPAAHIDALQRLNIAAGLQHHVVPFDQVADLRPAALARRWL